MRVLILGATGLIGRHLLAALHAAGHEAVGASRRAPAGAAASGLPGSPAWRELDFGALTDADAWLQHLAGIDVVVNCVGILRERSPGDYERLHHLAPAALFAACARAGIRRGIRVIHFSALGSSAEAPTTYWRSKAAGEEALARHPALDATIVRPSLVYGADGASSKLFLAIATLPVAALPAAHSSRVQPVHIDDLCAAVLALLERHTSTPPVPELAAVGPRAP
jgi:uncharacterized protein YbjT (DUF2867 family)